MSEISAWPMPGLCVHEDMAQVSQLSPSLQLAGHQSSIGAVL